ncbi:lipid-A-disaccharide synthase-related protein [Spirulina subsalsa FACHB-351]|uniref:Lipid-A-disaccharide synthase-related protein n=1 Tax=Spirulina subsalsa FACHB-351 TaxID=234711 RepID=A0ABT3L9J0_9CYAN|nr:lipid-A-disaccharide synthase-related protein [Spirulina subsalsa]MCW6038132.1 lipid-A-disaccharide synthase-related protein [Spirulina subsalsa FACHB-351]
MKLLCLSNGHGEDAIAVRILKQLQEHPNAPEVAALPLVGEGHAYVQAAIPIVGPVKKMPSGGFIYMDGRQLWNDVRGGLIGLTWAQYRLVRKWGKREGVILAVGDIVPLLLGWLSGAPYAFVGTAKSEYYLRDEAGWLSKNRQREGWSGSVYLPWERWLMQRPNCRAVFPRDTITTNTLNRFGIKAFDLGNPMMDDLIAESSNPDYIRNIPEWQEKNRPLTVALLPGSRAPEVYHNWETILEALPGVQEAFQGRSQIFLGAIASSLDPQPLIQALEAAGWQEESEFPKTVPFLDTEAFIFSQGKAQLVLTQQAYHACLLAADVAIAMAGTATEQFVGLGKPAISLPGKGPQFNPQFAEAQTRLLGVSVMLAKKPQDVGNTIKGVLSKPDLLQIIGDNGKKRMGIPGAARRIADCSIEMLSST